MPAGEVRRDDAPSLARWSDRLVEAGVLFLLVFTPLAFGTVEPWSEAIAEMVVLGMVVVWLLGMMLRDWEVRVELPPGWVPASLFVTLVFLQATPIPMALTQLLSPWTTGLYDQVRTYAGAGDSLVPLSLAPHETWREALYLPPANHPLVLKFARFFERFLRLFGPTFAGVIVVSATKELFPAVPRRKRIRRNPSRSSTASRPAVPRTSRCARSRPSCRSAWDSRW